MEPARTILFLCPHNAAKSVIAAAYFTRLARDRGLDYQAASAGTSPDAAPSPAVVAMLRDEGIDVAGYRPRRVTAEDLTSAHRVISLGCDPADLDGATSEWIAGMTCRRQARIWAHRGPLSSVTWICSSTSSPADVRPRTPGV